MKRNTTKSDKRLVLTQSRVRKLDDVRLEDVNGGITTTDCGASNATKCSITASKDY